MELLPEEGGGALFGRIMRSSREYTFKNMGDSEKARVSETPDPFPVWLMAIVWAGSIALMAFPVYKGFFWNLDYAHLYVAKNFFEDIAVGYKMTPMFFRPAYDLIVAIVYNLVGHSYPLNMLVIHSLFLATCIIVYYILKEFLKHGWSAFWGTWMLVTCSLYSGVLYFYTSGSNELVVSIYILGIILAYLKHPHRRWLLLLFYLPAFLFKETAIFIPFLFMTIDWWKGRLDMGWIKKMWVFFLVMILQISFKLLWVGSQNGINLGTGVLLSLIPSFFAHLALLISSPGFQVVRYFGETAGKIWTVVVSTIVLVEALVLLRGRVWNIFKKYKTIGFALLWILITLVPSIIYLHFGYHISSPLSISAGRQFFLPFMGLCIIVGWLLGKIWHDIKRRVASVAVIAIFFLLFGALGHLLYVDDYVFKGNVYRALLEEIERARDEDIYDIVVVGIGESTSLESIIYGDKDILMYKIFFEEEEGSYRHAESVEEAKEMLAGCGGRIIVWENNGLKELVDI